MELREVDTPTGALAMLLAEGGDGNRVVLSSGVGWVVISGPPGARSLLVEVAASADLPEDQTLTPRKIGLLRRAGFANRPGRRHLARHFALDEDAAIGRVVETCLRLLDEVFGGAGDKVQVQLKLGDAVKSANPRLLEAMRVLARKREHRYRTDVYRRLLDAKLILTVEEDGFTPACTGRLSGFPVHAAFSDWDAFTTWDPRAPPFRVVGGRVLFPELAGARIGSIQINPRGTVGGELYRNEVETLADAIHSRRRR